MSLLEKVVREVSTVATFARALTAVRKYKPGGSVTVPEIVECWADKTPEAVALVFDERSYTFAEVDEAANRVAAWAIESGIKPKEVVSLLMENRPEFLFAWLGLAKVGAVTALINTNLRRAQLAYALGAAGASRIIVGCELAAAWQELRGEIADPPEVWAWGGPIDGARDLGAVLVGVAAVRPSPAVRASIQSCDPIFYIFTSGTTGNPKAARFSHHRFLTAGAAYAAIADLDADDRMYCALPLYHTAGGVIAVGTIWLAGGTLVLKRKFSASSFFDDCRQHGVTVFQYAGELCRYLVQTPERPNDPVHSVRLALGNGLRPDVWPEFQRRFAIPKIVEFYGATAGNIALVNIDNKVGSVGRIPPYMRRVFAVKLVKFNVETETHPRAPDGFYVECGPGETGEAIGRIPDRSDVSVGRFEGYTGKADTEKGILRDVFKTGDAWFRSGDLLRRDRDGYFYFVDRIGDTFRWKGENVATNEVAEALSPFAGVQDVNVYGVEIPGTDGRAGMAALVCDKDIDVDRLYRHVRDNLAPYARPLFVRLRPAVDTAVTFKHRKVDLMRDGFDPENVHDPIYLRDDEKQTFVRLDNDLFKEIRDGRKRL